VEGLRRPRFRFWDTRGQVAASRLSRRAFTARLSRRVFTPLASVLALALALGAAACRRSASAPPHADANGSAERPPIVLVSIDTLRSDHLPAYGYRGVETPNIDRLRRDSILFSAAFSHVPLTLPSHATILTGLLPDRHGIRDNLGYRLDEASRPTLVERLKSAGYSTGGAVSAAVLARSTGLSAGFDFYDDAISVSSSSESISRVRRAGVETVAAASRWLSQAGSRPVFLFVHLYEPHAPYEPPTPFREKYPGRPYDGAIAAADAAVGSLLDALRSRGLYDRAAVVLLSDHGEGLGDHGEGEHGILLYREALAVPLLLKLPGSRRAGETVAAPAGLADVAPTLAALAGLVRPAAGLASDGRDLLELPARRAIASETFYPRIHLGWSSLRCLFDGSRHFIDGPRPELYDVGADPAERRDLFAAELEASRTMKRELDRRPTRFDAPRASAPGSEEARRLASLGYLTGSTDPGGGPLPNPADRVGDLAGIQAAFRLAASSAPGERRRAISAFRELLARNPRLFDVRYRLAETLRDLGDRREAEAEFAKAIEISPSLAGPAALEIARLAAARGDWEKAEAHAKAALPVSPAAAHEVLGRAALGRGDLDRAVSEAALARGDSADPDVIARAAVVTAGAELARGRTAEALAVLDAAAARTAGRSGSLPRDFEYFRGDALARAGRVGDAEAAFRREIAVYPDNVDAYARLAVVLAVEHRSGREVYGVLEAMARARPGSETALLAARTLDSVGDSSGAAAWRRRAAGATGR
jgi:arylsulfatase A-like enzyme/tetratricopeptide (TPR) repeat protein